MEGKDNFVEKSKTEKWEELARAVDVFSQEDPIPMEDGIKEAVITLMANNFRTVASCFGHLNEEDGKPYPWVAIRGDETFEALFDDERIKENNEKYFREAIEDKNLLTQDERDEIKQLQNRLKVSNESERQRLLGLIEEFYFTHNAEPGIKLTVSQFGWLCSEEVIDVDIDEIKKKTTIDELEKKLEKYRAEMNAFSQFLKDKFFAL